MMTDDQKTVLVVGLVCMDQVTVIDCFPKEDTDMRSVDQYKVRGGNANNSSTVLAELGFNVTYLGSLAEEDNTEFLVKGMVNDGIKVHDNCPRHDGQICPNSVVLSNRTSGSRTIIHTNLGLPELTLANFLHVDLTVHSWIHLEGRNKENVIQILHHINNMTDRPRVSVEVEKVGRGFEEFISLADVVFVSKDVAEFHGCNDMVEAVTKFSQLVKSGGSVIVAWGECGASCWVDKEGVLTCPAYCPPGGVVDTLGAGDTFNGTVLGCLASGLGLGHSVEIGCQVAGRKVGMRGFHGLGELCKDVLSIFKNKQ